MTHCTKCEAEAPLDSDGRCDYCSIETTEAEHEANNAALERVYTLDREETVSVTYEVRAGTLDEAVAALHEYDEESILWRGEDDCGALGEIRYLGRDSDWHHPGDATPPKTEEVPHG